MKHLNQKYFVWIIVVLSILIYGGYLGIVVSVKERLAFWDYIIPLSTVVLLDSIFLYFFIKRIWKWKKLYPWLIPFPNLNGTWKGHIKSTWVNPTTGKSPAPIPVILTIKQSFINVSCVMRTEEMESYSFVSDFVIDRDNQILRLV